MKKLFTLAFLLFLPHIALAAKPIITDVGNHKILVREESVVYLVTIRGENLDYIEDHFGEWDHPVISIGPVNPKEFLVYRDEDPEEVVVYFRFRPEVIKKRGYRVKVYNRNGDVIARSPQKIRIYRPAVNNVRVTDVSPKMVSMTSRTPFNKTIIARGPTIMFDYAYMEDESIRFGNAVSNLSPGDEEQMDIQFQLDPADYKNKSYARIRFFSGDTVRGVSQKIKIFNPYWKNYRNKRTQRFIHATNKTTASKRNVGLNVHWALDQSSSADNRLFKTKLRESNTTWVREHLSYDEFMGEESRTWIEQYDRVLRRHKVDGRRVVAMLAYGEDDSKTPPSTEQWAEFIELVTERYKNHVDAWEVWNEPDLAEFMTPNTVDALKPLLQTAYPIIKEAAPNSIVLNGGIGNIRTTAFISEMYQKAGNYFDQLAVHAYYCGEHVAQGNLNALKGDIQDVINAMPADRRDDGIWVTELGCTEAMDGVDQAMQKRHLQEATQAFLDTGKVNAVFLYNIRNRPNDTFFEERFGLMDENGNEKQSWQWYKSLPRR